MATEQDLRTALASREDLAPAASHVLVGLPARARRRRARSVVAIAAATVAVAAAIGTPVVLSWPHGGSTTTTVGSTTDPHAADRPPFSFTIAATVVDGYEIRPDGVSSHPLAQQASILAPSGGEPVAVLEVHAPGAHLEMAGTAPDSSWPMSSVGPLEVGAQVNGAQAVVRLAEKSSGVRWEYGPDAWAVMSTIPGHTPLDGQTLLAIAAGVRFVDPYPARVPFRLDDLPDVGLALAVSMLADGHGAVAYLGHTTLTVTDTTPTWPGYATWQWTPATIAGLPGRCSETPDPAQCELTFGDVRVLLGGFDAAERDQVVAGLHLATVADPSTWFDVVGAIPGA